MVAQDVAEFVAERVTTRYDRAEDRIRLLFANADDDTVSCWLTRRLLLVALPHFLSWLQGQVVLGEFDLTTDARQDAMQSFAQMAAQQQRQAVADVVVAPTATSELLDTINITTQGEVMQLKLSAPSGVSVRLLMSSTAMRQWLHTLHQQEQLAQWGVAWPAWLAESVKPAPCHSVTH